jgi:glyoxylase I family protein
MNKELKSTSEKRANVSVLGKIGSVNHLRLTVTDVPRAERFYNPLLEFLGYRLVERSDSRLAWAGWAAHGNLHWIIVSIASPEHRGSRHDRYAPGLHHLAFNADSRDEVDRFHDLLVRIGARVLDPPTEYNYEPGYYAVFFSDPDNLKLELVHVPSEGSQGYWHTFKERGHPLRT